MTAQLPSSAQHFAMRNLVHQQVIFLWHNARHLTALIDFATMYHLRFILSFLLVFCGSAQAAIISGAGSTAAMPLYHTWAGNYQKRNGLELAYQGVGSSAGIKEIKTQRVDFGASDVALSQEELNKSKLVQFPSAISGVVPIFNLPGIRSGDLRLTGEVLADIFASKIQNWNDPAILALNPAAHLPAKAIEVIVRQEGSGTTYNFTDYLAKVNSDWKTVFGRGSTIKWPTSATQVKGSSAIVAALKKTPYSISYVDYNYVVQEKLSYALIKNRDGKFVAPSALAFASALNNSGWRQANFDEMLNDRPGSATWPLTMGTFVILPAMAKDAEKTISVLQFFSWAFLQGDYLVNSVDLVRLPDNIQAKIYREMMKITDSNGRPLKWSLQVNVAQR